MLLIFAATMLLVTLASMPLSRRSLFFKGVFWISLEIYIAAVGIFVLNLLGEHDPVVIGFLLLIALGTFSLALLALRKD